VHWLPLFVIEPPQVPFQPCLAVADGGKLSQHLFFALNEGFVDLLIAPIGRPVAEFQLNSVGIEYSRAKPRGGSIGPTRGMPALASRLTSPSSGTLSR
jgi:hypothetical protein